MPYINWKIIRMFGTFLILEYLQEPFNKGLTAESYKKFICWDRFNPNWDVLAKFGYFQEYDESDWEQDYLDSLIDNY